VSADSVSGDRRQSRARSAALLSAPDETRDVVLATNQLASDMRADEARSADNQNARVQIQTDRFEHRGHGTDTGSFSESR
jgi:hypothetical protein